MLSCRELTERVTDFTEGHMPYRERMNLRIHLLMCRGCRNFVAQVRTTAGLAGRIAAPEPSAQAQQGLRRRFVAWASEPRDGAVD